MIRGLEGTQDEARQWALHTVLQQVEQRLGEVVAVLGEVPGTAPGWRLRLHIAGTGPVFLKAGDGGAGDDLVGAEVALITTVRHRHMPYVIAGEAVARVPWMVQPDLTGATWPPPWPRRMKPVWNALARLSEAEPPPWLPRPDDVDPWAELGAGGRREPSAEPWAAAAPRLAAAADRVSIAGDRLVHGDLGAGNLCLYRGGVLVVDWSDAMVANPALDLLSVAIEVAHSDGRRERPPVADLGGWMAKSAGLLLAASQRPAWTGEGGAMVRRAQAALARTAVEWALDLEG